MQPISGKSNYRSSNHSHRAIFDAGQILTLLEVEFVRAIQSILSVGRVSAIFSNQQQISIDCGEVSALRGEWLSRDATIAIGGLKPFENFVVSIGLRKGPAQLYDYFPFIVHIFADDCPGEIVEFDETDEVAMCKLSGVQTSLNGTLYIRFVSELGDSPVSRQLNNDVRILAAQVASFEITSSEKHHSWLVRAAASRAPLRKTLSPSARPIFVVGCYRSGTSITSWALGQHPNVIPLEETALLGVTLMGAMSAYRLDNKRRESFSSVYDLSLDIFLEAIGSGFNRLYSALGRERADKAFLARLSGKAEKFSDQFQLLRSSWSPKARWIDGTPENTMYGQVIAKAFPESQFIALIRKPRAVVASLLHFDRAGGAPRTRDEGVRLWISMTQNAISTCESMGGRRGKIVFYEDLVENPEIVLAECFDFLGEPNFSKAAAAFSTRINSSRISPNEIPDGADERLERCDEIYRALRLGTRTERIDWGSHDSVGERYNDQISRILDVFS